MSKDTSHEKCASSAEHEGGLSRRDMLLNGTSVLAAAGLTSQSLITPAEAQQKKPSAQAGQKPNILVIWGGDIGMWNIIIAA